MSSKKTRVILWAAIAIVFAGIVALGITLVSRMKPQIASEVIAEVEWYSLDEKEFVITTADELYDIAKLSEFCDFKGQTIKLGADIVVNEGNAEDWADDAPSRKWYAIKNFAGTFEGQGHTISGIYSKGYDNKAGLFSNPTTTAVFNDFKIKNSYMESVGASGLGSVASGMNVGGTYRRIYSDVILVSDSDNVGGMIGAVKFDTTIDECWYDGTIYSEGWCLGGMIGEARRTKKLNVSHCLMTGEINSTYDGPYQYEQARVGGIIGWFRQTGSPVGTFDDCFVDATFKTKLERHVASIAGYLDINTTTNFSNMYASKRTHALTYTKAGSGGTLNGNVIAYGDERLIGEKAYQWTTLDFDKYWIAVEGDTPKLAYFTEGGMDLSNVKRAFDISWYDETQKEYTISTNEQLYGFSLMASMQNNTFSGKTIKVGANLKLNDGDAAKWDKEAPKIEWLAIKGFHGTFDGQGHTISGLYVDATDAGQGMFGSTQKGAVIKNFRLKNSFFRVTNDTLGNNIVGLGSIVGKMQDTTIDSVYSDAIVINASAAGIGTGGIAGNVSVSAKNTISNCWFDGYVESSWRNVAGIIGYVSNGSLDIMHCLNSGEVYKKDNNTATRGGAFIGDVTGWSSSTTIKIEDCLNVGLIKSDNANQSGSIIGYMTGNSNPAKRVTTEINGKDVYTTVESHKRTVGTVTNGAVFNLTAGVMNESEWIGFGGYTKTTLDFKNYWAVDLDGTPILKTFASKVPSTNGVARWDTTWYNESKNTFVLTDKYDLYGLALLAATGKTFEGKTVKLGNDIVVNSGNAENWKENPPTENWFAISGFAGTFDGQGHTISGVYLKKNTSKQGLFGSTTKTAVVKNFKLTNSYFEAKAEEIAANGSNALGSVVGSASGVVENIYSDAIVVNTSTKGEAGTGGIVGYGSDVKIIGCWYDGTLTSEWKGNAGIVGYVSNSTALIKSCLNTGTISQTIKSQPSRTAGIVGEVLEWSVETVVTIEDCLNVGTIKHVNPNQAGAILGYTSGNAAKKAYPVVNGSNVYMTTESHARPTSVAMDLTVVKLNEADLKGYNGYIKTTLDFDNYWAVVSDGTPILKKFANTVPSLAGIERYDISWYDDSKDSFVITKSSQLNGLSLLSSMGKNFKNKKVILGADIALNTGDANTWAASAPKNSWTPIAGFAGTFDGKGHTISGVYVNGKSNQQGLFGSTTKDAVVKNFKLTNSYFTTNASGIASNAATSLGSVAGLGYGTFKNIYSNAIVDNKTQVGEGGVGGIIGSSNGDGTVVSNCWFDGTVISNWRAIGGIIGYVSNGEAKILHCLNSGTLNQTIASQPARTAGMVGYVLEWSVETKVTIEDSLNVGTITTTNPNQKGSIVGFLYGNTNTGVYPEVVGKDVYATSESCSRTSGVSIDLAVTVLSETTMIGYGAYKWTNLDFEDCWAVDLDGTPVLQTFAEEIPDLTNIVKPDISWYDENETKFVLTTAAQMEGFSALVNRGEDFTGKKVELGANIELNKNAPATKAEWLTYISNNSLNQWVPIGTEAVPFTGSFDGNGHTIRGIYIDSTGTNQALFGVTFGATIKDVKIENSYLKNNNYYLASVVGVAKGGSISGIYTNAILESTMNNEWARVAGIVAQAQDKETTISNCWFDGTILSAGGRNAGIMSWAGGMKVTITHCLNTGVIENSYNKDSSEYIGGIVGGVTSNTNTVLIVEDSINAGTLKLNGTTTLTGTVFGWLGWNAKVTVDNTYTTTNKAFIKGVETAHKTIYSGGMIDSGTGLTDLTGKDVTGVNALSHMNLDYSNFWTLRTGKVPTLKSFVPAETSMLELGWYDETKDTYTISTPGELFGLAYLAKTTDFAGKTIKLGADIAYNKNTPATLAEWTTFVANNELNQWVAIGSGTKPFAGTFDGQGHTISGLYFDVENVEYQGLFGAVKGATLKNFKVSNSYMESNYPLHGAIAGRVLNSTVSGVYSNAIVKNTRSAENARVGGLFGMIDTGKTTIDNCQFAGSVYSVGGSIGGLTGKVDAISSPNVEISNFLFTGHLESTWNGSNGTCLGGVIGWRQNTTTVKITDSISAGTYKVTNGTSVGTVIGLRHWTGSVSCTDVYVTKNAATVAGATTTLNPGGSGQANFTAGATDLTGKSFDSMALDFDKYWKKVDGSNPVLKSFAN